MLRIHAICLFLLLPPVIFYPVALQGAKVTLYLFYNEAMQRDLRRNDIQCCISHIPWCRHCPSQRCTIEYLHFPRTAGTSATEHHAHSKTVAPCNTAKQHV